MATGYSAKLWSLVLQPINSILRTIHNESFTDDDLTSILNKLEDFEKVIYQIVGDDEADIKAGKISISSPIARAMISKYEGDVVDVQAPGGVISYEVDEVVYQ